MLNSRDRRFGRRFVLGGLTLCALATLALGQVPLQPKPSFIEKQAADQWLASKFMHTEVIGTEGTKIGTVNDILFDKDKKVIAYIVGVGGFLGAGVKDIGITPESFQFVPGRDATDYSLRLPMTKDALKAVAAFEATRPTRP